MNVILLEAAIRIALIQMVAFCAPVGMGIPLTVMVELALVNEMLEYFITL